MSQHNWVRLDHVVGAIDRHANEQAKQPDSSDYHQGYLNALEVAKELVRCAPNRSEPPSMQEVFARTALDMETLKSPARARVAEALRVLYEKRKRPTGGVLRRRGRKKVRGK